MVHDKKVSFVFHNKRYLKLQTWYAYAFEQKYTQRYFKEVGKTGNLGTLPCLTALDFVSVLGVSAQELAARL